jgi:adenylate cyclase
LVRLINEYLSLASAPIVENDGVIDKYMGDGVMSFWCQPFVEEGAQAKLACQAALSQFDQLNVLHGRLPDVTGLRRDLPEIEIRIGLASGEAIVGSIGSEYAKNFTVMGDTVNIASRLEGANKVYGTRVLVCEETWNRAGESFEMREIDSIAVQGKIEPLRIFELLGAKGSLSEEVASARDDFEVALGAYRARNWDEAERLFGKCLKEWPDDRPASVFLERIQRLRASPPPESWDGVWSLNAK